MALDDVFLKMESSLHRFFFALRRRLRLGRKGYREAPCQRVTYSDERALSLIQVLQQAYAPDFELRLNQVNTLENYHVLHLLSEAQKRLGFSPRPGLKWLDVGSKNFYYADVLNFWFQPKRFVGLELDGYKLYRDWHSRADYGHFYASQWPGFEYVVGDFLKWQGEAFAGVTLFYPFVFPYPLVKWTLPLKHFQPVDFFKKIYDVLEPGGQLFMVNHGKDEWEEAQTLAQAAGLELKGDMAVKKTVLPREVYPWLSVWKKS